MPMIPIRLDHRLVFPDPSLADEDGLLAMGGDLSPERLLLAYRNGIFPWFSGRIPEWYCPDPRFVLFPEELKVSRSMRLLLRRDAFEVTTNRCFLDVIQACRGVIRPGQWGTWITPSMVEAYVRLHEMGHAVSVEAWQEGTLVGGLYGIRMGGFFFGESMFSRVSNASKYAFITHVRMLQQEGVGLVDCQVYTPHLDSLGARFMPRDEFLEKLEVLRKER
ncbi:MAG: leucyl/phenylalanyl-tRNA--protein transferase [Chitinophagia bacterium]|nr:leucyl/phenylalanyl-tRNA--protein transferase [Chitinophagia bacterium]